MSEDIHKKEQLSGDDRTLAKLLELAGPRAEIPHAVTERTYQRVRREWQASTITPDSGKIYKRVRRAWKRDSRIGAMFWWSLPIGGVAAAVLALFVMLQPAPAPDIAIATVTRHIASPSTAPEQPARPVGTKIFAGDLITTADGEGLSLRLARSESLRVDGNTSLQVDDKDRFTLLAGRVYVDTGQFVYRDGGLIIDTSQGAVSDVGTQFQVVSDPGKLEVSVREGRVNIDNDDDRSHVVIVGERITLRPGDEPVVTAVAPHDASWDWVARLAPAFDTSKKSLYDFLRWAARETGRELAFANDALQMSAMKASAGGDISRLTPEEALEAILSTTSFAYRIEPARILIVE